MPIKLLPRSLLKHLAICSLITVITTLVRVALVVTSDIDVKLIYSVGSTRSDLVFFLHAGDPNELLQNLCLSILIGLVAWFFSSPAWVTLLGLIVYLIIGITSTSQNVSNAIKYDCSKSVTADFCGTAIIGARIGGLI